MLTIVFSIGLPSWKKSITSLIVSTPYTSKSLTMAASLAFSLGRIMPLNFSFLASIAIGKTPFIGFSMPSNDNSPMIIYLSKSGALICPEAAKIPIAIVKS